MNSQSEIFERYNPEQLEAIMHDNGPLLVIAGAGTGKTAVITARITRLILQKNISPEKILALTFTDKAAAEMEQRVDEALPYGYIQTQIMTFHALADRLLREYALDIGLSPDYQVVSKAQQTIILQEIVAGMKFNYYSPANQPFGFVQSLLQAIGRLKDEGIDPKELKSRLLRLKKDLNAEQYDRYQELLGCYQAYQKAFLRHNFVDFGDLLLYLQQLMIKRPSIQKEIANCYEYILVDEFQDTNSIQMKILTLLLNKQQNLMVVGDDDQAIYKFRGASVQNILDFTKLFPDTKIVTLVQNYRSGQEILDSAYRLIQYNNPNRLEDILKINKNLKAQKGSHAKLEYSQFAQRPDEQSSILQNIQKLLKTGVESKSVAILLRKNSQIKPYIQLLERNNIPFYVNQSVDLFEQKPIKMLLALCIALAEPKNNQALYQVLVSPLFSIQLEELIDVFSRARSSHSSLEEIAMTDQENADLNLQAAFEQLADWRGQIRDVNAGELLYVILKQTGYLAKLLKNAVDDSNAAQEVQLIAEFFQIVKEFELSSQYHDITSFSIYIQEIHRSASDIYAEISPLDIDGVQILTVHRAKGLEFDHVFLPELNEQLFPTYTHAEKIKLDLLFDANSSNHYQEERRLFYVAMTRAKQGLYMSNALDHGGKRAKRTSRFVHEALGGNQQSMQQPTKVQTNFAEFFNSFAPQKIVNHGDQLMARFYDDGWLRLSTNQIADYLRSPREFWLFQVLRMPKGPYHALVYGSAIHAALEYYYVHLIKSKSVTYQELQQVFKNAWDQEGFVSAEHNKLLYNQGLKVIRSIASSKIRSQDKPMAVEKPFEMRLPDIKLIISGRYDLVLKRSDGVEIRDFKTSDVTSEKAAQKRAKDSVQLGIYALSWQKLQQTPVQSTSLEFVNTKTIGENSSINHEKTLQKIQTAAEGIRTLDFESQGSSQLNFERLLP